jgi:hypothetical protein
MPRIDDEDGLTMETIANAIATAIESEKTLHADTTFLAFETLLGDMTVEGDVVRFGVQPVGERIPTHKLARAHYVARQLERLADEFKMADGPKALKVSTQLPPHLRDEARQIAAAMKSWDESTTASDETTRVLTRADSLFGLAQPGMKYFVGDADAMKRWSARRDRVLAMIDAWRETHGDLEKLLDGRIGASEVSNVQRVKSELDRRRATLTSQIEALDLERAGLSRALAPIERALGALARR